MLRWVPLKLIAIFSNAVEQRSIAERHGSKAESEDASIKVVPEVGAVFVLTGCAEHASHMEPGRTTTVHIHGLR